MRNAFTKHWASLPKPVRWLLIAAFVLFVAGPFTSALAWAASKILNPKGEVKWEL